METKLKEKNFISAVLYMNSAASVEVLDTFVSNLTELLNDNFSHFEIICVDDDTPISYSERIRQKATDGSPIAILHMSHYQGIEVAMNAGRDLAIGDFIIEFDECIWNFPDDMIMKVYERCLQDIDIVSCSDTSKKHLTSKLFYLTFNHFSDFKYDLHSDNFRILSRRSINRIQSLNRTVPYRKALYANSGLTMDTLSYTSDSSGYASNRESRKTRKALAVDSLLLFTNVGYKCSLGLSLVMALIMVMIALYAIIIYVSGNPMEGWTTTVLFSSFAFFGLFTILTIIIKYLSLLLNLSFKRNRYLYSSIEKL